MFHGIIHLLGYVSFAVFCLIILFLLGAYIYGGRYCRQCGKFLIQEWRIGARATYCQRCRAEIEFCGKYSLIPFRFWDPRRFAASAAYWAKRATSRQKQEL
ncbi:MAG: hypothetical protein V1867_05780 [Candidatus Falkowbacteria bacterium]